MNDRPLRGYRDRITGEFVPFDCTRCASQPGIWRSRGNSSSYLCDDCFSDIAAGVKVIEVAHPLTEGGGS